MLNKVQLIGNVGNEPEIRYTQDNKPIANLSIATSERWKDKNGQPQEKTEWHRVVLFDGIAGVVEKYVKKGDKLYIEGKLQTRKWQDKEGRDVYTTEIVVNGFGGSMVMLGGKSESKAPAQSTAQKVEPASGEIENDEIPF